MSGGRAGGLALVTHGASCRFRRVWGVRRWISGTPFGVVGSQHLTCHGGEGLSTSDTERFRITTWPATVEAPGEVAVPRLVSVVDVTGPGEVPLRDSDLPQNLRRVAHHARDDEFEEHVWADLSILHDTLSCVDAFTAASSEIDWPPALIYLASSPEVKAAPDEFFLRQVLAVDPSIDDQLLQFLSDWGPLVVDRVPRESGYYVKPQAWIGFDLLNNEELRSQYADLYDYVDDLASPNIFPETLYEHPTAIADDLRTIASQESSNAPLHFGLSSGRYSASKHEFDIVGLDDFALPIGHGTRAYYPDGENRIHIPLTAMNLDSQRTELQLIQALVETWIAIDPSTDLDLDEMNIAPRAELLRPWLERGLPAPETRFELISSAVGLLTEAVAWFSPRVELTHPSLSIGGYGRPLPGVRDLIGLQLLAWIAEGTPARQCANETCQQWFAKQIGRSSAGQHRRSGVQYCSPSCAKAQAQRSYRRRQRLNGGTN